MTMKCNATSFSASPSCAGVPEEASPCKDEKKQLTIRSSSLRTYQYCFRAECTQNNRSLDFVRVMSIGVKQCVDGSAFFIGKMIKPLLFWISPCPLEKLVQECVQAYDIADVHTSRFPPILKCFLSQTQGEELFFKVSVFIHVIAKLKALAGMEPFLMMTQPRSYHKSSYPDVLECLQGLVTIYSKGLVSDFVLDSMKKFHSAHISIQELLASLKEGESAERYPVKKLQREGATEPEHDLVLDIQSVLGKDAGTINSFLTLMKRAKNSLGKKVFSLLLNATSYHNMTEITSLRNVIHWLEKIHRRHGCVDDLLKEFYKARISVRELEHHLEEIFSQLVSLPPLEEKIEDVLARFSLLNPDQKAFMQDEYKAICLLGEELRHESFNTLVLKAKIIQKRCENVSISKEDSRLLLAIAREAILKEFGLYPYNTQVLAILGLLHHPEKLKGSIAQVKTGEGKSTIIAMLALYLACQGKYIDIISSSRYLAQRDAEKYFSFFVRFDISTSHLCTDAPSSDNFSGQIIFSTNFDAEFSVMRDYFVEKGMRVAALNAEQKARPFHAVIVDEVDNLFIDSALNSARIAIPGSLSMKEVYAPLFDYVRRNHEVFCSLLERENISASKEFIEARELVRNSLKGPQEIIELFLDERVDMLLRSARRALELSEGKEYIVRSIDGKKEIVIVDQANTGRLAEKSKWSHGIHQFLEVKHEAPLEEEHVMPASLSHPVFFRNYEKIFGLTGTLGSSIEQEEVQKTYEVNTFYVPSYRPCLRKTLEPFVCSTQNQHYEMIINDIKVMIDHGRPSLVLFESIQQAHKFSSYCSSQMISTLTLTACQANDEEYIIAQAGHPGKVTIATNTAGRGTDIVLHKDSLQSGGLHVIFTYLPANERVEEQGIGRAGRQGQPGSSRIIVLIDNPFLTLADATLKKDESQLLQNITYSLFLSVRERKTKHLSSARRLRTAIELVNHSYLMKFVDQCRDWLATSQKHDENSSASREIPPMKEKIDHITQIWAEHFYTRLDELFHLVQKNNIGDHEVETSYKKEIEEFYASKKHLWETLIVQR